jgi:hypothetical protein
MPTNAKILSLTTTENSLSKDELQIVALFSKAIITHCKSKAYDSENSHPLPTHLNRQTTPLLNPRSGHAHLRVVREE